VCINKEIKLPAECDLRVHAINTYTRIHTYVSNIHRYNRNGSSSSSNNNNGQVGTVIKGNNRETCCCHS